MLKSCKGAIVCDWLIDFGGAERCVEVFHEILPDAPIYSLYFEAVNFKDSPIKSAEVRCSFLNRYGLFRKHHRLWLALYPFLIEQFDFSGFDLIISNSHSVAKGLLRPTSAKHICYCHTPMRYIWDLYNFYLKNANLDKGLRGLIAKAIMHYIRIWDVASSGRVDLFIANSKYVAYRIEKIYGRKAEVIYPPVDVLRFHPKPKDNFFIFLSRLVPYKRADIAVEVCTKLRLPLVVIGDGTEIKKLKNIAGKEITFLGYQPDDIVSDYLARARALIFCAEEDFGIVPLEAQASGTPVIAFGRGGALETVVPPVRGNMSTATGIFFNEQRPESLCNALESFIKVEDSFREEALLENASRFNRDRFKMEISDIIERVLANG